MAMSNAKGTKWRLLQRPVRCCSRYLARKLALVISRQACVRGCINFILRRSHCYILQYHKDTLTFLYFIISFSGRINTCSVCGYVTSTAPNEVQLYKSSVQGWCLVSLQRQGQNWSKLWRVKCLCKECNLRKLGQVADIQYVRGVAERGVLQVLHGFSSLPVIRAVSV